MSYYSKVNFFKEKLILKQEENSLREMLTKFQDQLNRLKVEELALVSHIKMQAERKSTSMSVDQVEVSVPELEEPHLAATQAPNPADSGPSSSWVTLSTKQSSKSTVSFAVPVNLKIPITKDEEECAEVEEEDDVALDLTVPSTSSFQGFQSSKKVPDNTETEDDSLMLFSNW